MLLKSVEMQGFKSFADKIYLDFNPGITAIVGPNGSGKSNISDAIRWVMGEQSIKNLRGSKMEDIIFSGTQTRKALGYAEVTLNLDNSTGFFPLDYDEISVTRRVYRNGDGEYYINKSQCRLKDIHELFMDTGLGREGYSIIGQGKIDEILSNKSEDRRQIFEEAAGITKYKYRKNEAERKLASTTENLTRVKDIMSTLEGQVEPLREQSEKAKKYLNFREELKGLEIDLSVVNIDKIKAETAEIEVALKDAEESIQAIRTAVEKNENEINESYKEIAEIDEKTELLRTNERNLLGEINESDNKININNANIEHNKENIARIEAEIKGLKDETEDARGQLTKIEEDTKEVLGKIEEISVKISGIEEEIKNTDLSTGAKSEELESIKADIINKQNDINRLREKILNSKILTENFENRKRTINNELSERQGDYDKLCENVKNLEAETSKKEKVLEDFKTELEKVKTEAESAEEKLSDITIERADLTLEFNKLISRKNVLSDLEKEYDGYAGSVKAIMTAYEGNVLRNKIYGPLSRLINTDNKYIVAIETALGNAGQNIVVETEEDAKSVIEFLKQKKAGRATFLPCSSVKGRKTDVTEFKSLKGYIGIASELVETDKKYAEIISSVLGAIIVCDNIDNAVLMARKINYKFKIVTLTGEVIQVGGAITGGSVNKATGFLSRTAEITAIDKEIDDLSKKLDEKAKAFNMLSEEAEEYKAKAEKARENIGIYNEDYIKQKAELEHSSAFLNSLTEGRNQLEEELKTINEQIENIEKTVVDCEKEIAENEKAILDLEESIGSKENDFEALLKENQRLSEILLKLNIEKNSLEKDREVLSEKGQSVVEYLSKYNEKIAESNNEILALNEKIGMLLAEIEEATEKIKTMKENSSDATSEVEKLTKDRNDREEEIRKLQKEITDTNESMYALSQQQAKMEAKNTRLSETLEGIFNHLWEEYEITYSDAVAIKGDKEINVAETGKEIASLKHKIKALGNINIDAIEDYKNVKERFDFLTEQTNDLEKAKAELERVIADMMVIMKKQFSKQFEVINKNFNKVFSELFGGGQATLSLVDPENVLETGIEIEAQPPGKKLQRLSLLSGGERAFTAIALLFAILNVRPTPFCILDEIEAALDDVNVFRYAEYLKRYARDTQFIVVTHRRGTMEAANILYGVTMQEKGVSKLLSLNIDEVVE